MALGIAASAPGQWKVVSLHPIGAYDSVAQGVDANSQVGAVENRASIWSGTAASWVDLHPQYSFDSRAYAVSGTQQVGYSYQHGFYPGLWNGTAESWLRLDYFGVAYDVENGQQVGVGERGAAIWRGSEDSRIDLNPPGSAFSVAYGFDGDTQTGFAQFSGIKRAGLWRGRASSWVSLHPAGLRESLATGIYSGQQVGYVTGWFSPLPVASLWTGSASSWRSLQPPYASASLAWGVYSGQQVGYITVDGQERACLWRGAAGSVLNLHAFLPDNYLSSEALGIWSNDTRTVVVGYAINGQTKRPEAMMWIGPPPPKLTARP